MTQSRLKEVLHYEPTTGVFTRLISKSGSGKIGSTVGSIDSKGYLNIMIDRTSYGLHRLAILYMTGRMPLHYVDHEDHNPSNNIYTNLKEVTHIQNNMNRSIGPLNKSGFVGVYWCKKAKRWMAQIKADGKIKHLGSFIDKELAIEARKAANIQYGYHKNHGKPNKRKQLTK